MKGFGKRFLSVATALSMVAAMAPQSLVVSASEIEYQIYPTPHSIAYEDTTWEVKREINVVFESGIDEVTENKVEAVLEDNYFSMKETDKTAKGTNLLVGVYGSDEYVDTYAEENIAFDAATFEHYDSYVLDIDAENETIVILGKDTDGAFYGVVSLMHILDQSKQEVRNADDSYTGLEVRDLTMEDYADTSIRGFIEGYYGIPWSNEDRMSLMEFGGQFKMTSYVFAPKDDPYHTTKWRQLYPDEEIAEIAEMVAVGNANKCRFVWTAHPFMGGFNSSDVDGEIEALLAKFDQLYSVGVRQFGVLGDDVGSLNKDIVIQVMNAVSEWAAEKGDVYDSVFCPAGYNHSWQGNYSELNTYDAGFPDDVQIFWTGEAVCQPVEVKTLDHFRNYNATNGQRRAPLFWLNWPVNDINMSRLLMGKGSLLRTDVNPEDLVGVVTNPMQDAECSKVAIFAVADYTWNIAEFDCDQSWADSFAYIDEDASEELHTLAKHMSNPQPNGHGLVLDESEELQPLIEEFETKLANGESLAGTSDLLAAEMEKIIAACDGFHEKSKNEAMKEEILPFSEALKDTATAIYYYAKAAQELENEDDMAAFEAYMLGFEAQESSSTHMRPTLSGSQVAQPGSTYLIPLAETIQEAIADEITAIALGDVETAVKKTGASSFSSFYEGSVANLVDGDESTHAWYGGYEAAGQYYQVNLSRPCTVYGIDVLNGTASKPADTFGNAKLQYTTDGTTWVDVNEEIYSDYPERVTVSDIAIENVVAVRYICTEVGSGNKWPSMREFTVVTEKAAETGVAYTNADAYKDVAAAYGIDTNSLDAVEVTLAKDEYIGLKLDRIHELSDIVINGQSVTDVILAECYDVQISMNSVEWEGVIGQDVAGKDARYIRILKADDCTDPFAINEFVVTTNEIYGKSVVDTNYTSFEGDELAVFDGDWTTATQYANSQIAGKYIVYDLGTVVDMESFKVVCTDSEWDFPRHGKFSVSADGENWTEIMTLGNQDSDNEGESTTEDEIGSVLPDHEISYNTKTVDGLDVQARYLKFEITRTKSGNDKWVRFQELEINGGAYIPTSNDPTFEGVAETNTTKYANMQDINLATAFAPEETTGELIFHVSEAGINNLKFIQNGISNAQVRVRTAANPESWIYIGSLAESISVLKCDGVNTTDILDVKITWEDTSLKLIEIQALTGEYGDTVPEPTPIPSWKNPFTDVAESDWYYKAVAWGSQNSVVAGLANDKFGPAVSCTRAQIVAFIWRAEGRPEPTNTDCPFTDVASTDYYYKAMLWAVEKGIAKGYTADKFAPDATCTRAEMATFIWRLENKAVPEGTENPFIDVVDGEWYTVAAQWTYENGIVSGYDTDAGKEFAPANTIARAETVTMLYRYYNR